MSDLTIPQAAAEHQLFIAHQVAFDAAWDLVRPTMLAAEKRSEGWPGFLRVAFLAGQLTGAITAAARQVMGRRSLGEL